MITTIPLSNRNTRSDEAYCRLWLDGFNDFLGTRMTFEHVYRHAWDPTKKPKTYVGVAVRDDEADALLGAVGSYTIEHFAGTTYLALSRNLLVRYTLAQHEKRWCDTTGFQEFLGTNCIPTRYEDGMTVAELKAAVMGLQDTDDYGNPCSVWISDGEGRRHPVRGLKTLNVMGDQTPQASDILLEP